MSGFITGLTEAEALAGTELLEISQPSPSVTITATTIFASSADNSINDSANGFVTAGFAAGDRVTISGFGTSANNLLVGTLESVAAGKLVFEAPEGDAIVDEVAGASVTITKWTTKRTTAQEIADLAGGGGGGSAVAVDDEGVEVVALASRLNFVGDGVTVTDGGGGEAIITVPGGGGGGGGGSGGTLTTVPTSAQWRIRFPDSSKALAAGTSFGAGLSELRWLDDDLTTQLATGGTPIASSTFTVGGTFALAEAYDGSTAANNGWYASEFPSGSFNAWIGYQFAAPVKPAAISFAPLNGFPDTVPATVVVEYLDGTNIWQPIAIYYPGPGVNDTFQTFTLPESYVQLPVDGGARLWASEGIAIIGDSITEQTPGGVNWAVELRKTLGLASAPVDGVSGSVMASVAGRIAALDLTSVGTLMIFMGTNDYGNSGGRALGALGDDGADNTFYGDVYEAIEAAMTAKPELRLIFVTPIPRTDQTAANAQGKVLLDYVNAIIDTCARYSIPVYDAHRNIGFNALNFSTYSSDGLHPNAIGHRRLARAFAGFLLGT